jgi:Ni/Co efflux regulator RcnB
MKTLVIAAAILSLAGGGAALAQPHGHDRHENRQDHRADRRDFHRGPDRDRFSYRGRFHSRFRGPVFHYPRGFAYRSWSRGQLLPRVFLSSPYFLNNWTYYNLGPPPRGYRYIRVGPDVLLVNIRTGRISETIPGVFY